MRSDAARAHAVSRLVPRVTSPPAHTRTGARSVLTVSVSLRTERRATGTAALAAAARAAAMLSRRARARALSARAAARSAGVGPGGGAGAVAGGRAQPASASSTIVISRARRPASTRRTEMAIVTIGSSSPDFVPSIHHGNAEGPATLTDPSACTPPLHPRSRAALRPIRATERARYCLMICPRISPPGNEELCTFVYALPLLSSTLSESPVMVLFPLAMGKVRSIVPVLTTPLWVADTV